MSKNRDLTTKQFIFCKEYLIDFNATRAAIAAGYSEKTAKSQGSRMLTNVNIKEFLDESKQKRADKLEITAEIVIQELGKIALHDIRKLYNDDGMLLSVSELDDDTASVISSFKATREYQGKDEDGNAEYSMVEEYKRIDKVKPLELLGKHFGIFEKDNGQKIDDKTITAKEPEF